MADSLKLQEAVLAFSRRSKRIAWLTGISALMIGAAFAVSADAGIRLRRARDDLRQQLASQRAELTQIQKASEDKKAQLERLHREVSEMRQTRDAVFLGLNRFYAKDYEGAVRAYTEALGGNPDGSGRSVLLNLRGYALLRLGRHADAVRDLKRSTELDPTYSWSDYNLSLAYWKAGDRDEAIKLLQALLRKDPSFAPVIRSDPQFLIMAKDPRFVALLK